MEIKKLGEFINESHYDPWKNVTYKFEVSILFSGFEPTTLKGFLIFLSDEQAQEKKDEHVALRLKGLSSDIVRYELISFEKASQKEQIYPMH